MLWRTELRNPTKPCYSTLLNLTKPHKPLQEPSSENSATSNQPRRPPQRPGQRCGRLWPPPAGFELAGVGIFWGSRVFLGEFGGLQFLGSGCGEIQWGPTGWGEVKGQVFFCLAFLMQLFSVDGSSAHVATTSVSDAGCGFFSSIPRKL